MSEAALAARVAALEAELEATRVELDGQRAIAGRVMASYQQRALQMEVIRQQNDDLDKLEAELSELGFDDGRTGLEYDANFADTSQVTAERGEAEALAGQLKESLEEVASAITRLDEGTYGTCEVCGVAINPARLEAMPATRFCIDHANRS